MASQTKVQQYLDRHKVGQMFEELMAKLMSDMPEDPIPFLVKTLEKKHRRNLDPLRRSGEPVHSRGRASPDVLRKTTPASFNTQDMAVAKSRPRIPSTGSAPRKSTSATSAKPTKSNESNAKPAWAEDHEYKQSSFGYRGPRQRKIGSVLDPLEGELGLVQDRPSPLKSRDEVFKTASSRRQARNHDAAAVEHKRQLELMILKSQHANDSGYDESKDADSDFADEVMEDPDLLKEEGVRSGSKSAFKLSKAHHKKRAGAEEGSVRVSICARCATIMQGGAVPSVPAEEPVKNYGRLPSFDEGSDVKSNRGPSNNGSPGLLSDEEFESVSQVTGPRRPVWNAEEANQTTDMDSEANTTARDKVVKKNKPAKTAASSVASTTQKERRLQSQEESDHGLSGRGWDRPTEEEGTEVSSVDWRNATHDPTGPY